MEAARSAASFMDGCVVAVQVEDFGLPKSAVGTAGQTSKIFKIGTLLFKPSRLRLRKIALVEGTLHPADASLGRY